MRAPAKLQGAQERKAKKTCRIKTMSAKAKLCTKFVNIYNIYKVLTRGTSILGEVRNVEIPGPTQQLLCSKYHDFLAIFSLAHSQINQIS